MARTIQPMLGNAAFGQYSKTPVLDPSYGGQMGWSPNLSEWTSNQAYVRPNLICVLLEAPKFFSLMPDPAKMVQILKSFVELHAKTIDGLKAGLVATYEQHAIGGAGEMQDELTNVTRDRSEPVFTCHELYGMPIAKFLDIWLRYGGMDPETKHALIHTLPTNITPLADYLADWFTMSCIFIEPDVTHKHVVKSWVVSNMAPKGTGDIVGKKDKTGAGELTEMSVEFTGIAQFNFGTSPFAQTILDGINLTNANPALRESFIASISPDVLAAKGYKEQVASVAAAVKIA